MGVNGALAEPKPAERRSWALQECSCGCGERKPWHRLVLVKGHDNKAYFVTAACEEPFKLELENRHRLKEMFTRVRGRFFLGRWKFAKMVWLLTYCIFNRLHGEARSRAIARRQVALFCSPDWLARFIGKRWAP